MTISEPYFRFSRFVLTDLTLQFILFFATTVVLRMCDRSHTKSTAPKSNPRDSVSRLRTVRVPDLDRYKSRGRESRDYIARDILIDKGRVAEYLSEESPLGGANN